MNATKLRALGFIEAAEAADATQWQGERARVYVEHIRKSPHDVDLCAELTDDDIALANAKLAEYNAYCAELTDDEIAL